MKCCLQETHFRVQTEKKAENKKERKERKEDTPYIHSVTKNELEWLSVSDKNC